MDFSIGAVLQIALGNELVKVKLTAIGEDFFEGDVVNHRCLKSIRFVGSQVVAILTA